MSKDYRYTLGEDIKKRLLHDSKQLSLKQFAYLSEKMVEVEDQLKKWKTYY